MVRIPRDRLIAAFDDCLCRRHVNGDQIFLVWPGDVDGVWQRIEIVRGRDQLGVCGAVAAVAFPQLQHRGMVKSFSVPELVMEGEGRVWFGRLAELDAWALRVSEFARTRLSALAAPSAEKVLAMSGSAREAADRAWEWSPELRVGVSEEAVGAIVRRLTAEKQAMFERLTASPALVGEILPLEHRAALGALLGVNDDNFLRLGAVGGIRPALSFFPPDHPASRLLIDVSDEAMCRLRMIVDRSARTHGLRVVGDVTVSPTQTVH